MDLKQGRNIQKIIYIALHYSTLCFPKSGGILPPAETLLKLGLIYVGMLLEFFTGRKDYDNAHHITMLFFFSIHCIFEVLYHYYRVRVVPVGLDYLSVGLAFAVEAFLFSYHLEVSANRVSQGRRDHTLWARFNVFPN